MPAMRPGPTGSDGRKRHASTNVSSDGDTGGTRHLEAFEALAFEGHRWWELDDLLADVLEQPAAIGVVNALGGWPVAQRRLVIGQQAHQEHAQVPVVNGLDQRGLPRTPPCDIGAYELQP